MEKSKCPCCGAVGSLEEQHAILEEMRFEIVALSTGAPQVRPQYDSNSSMTCAKCGLHYTPIDPKATERRSSDFLQTWSTLIKLRREKGKGVDPPDRL